MRKNIFSLGIIILLIILSSFTTLAYEKSNMPNMIKVGLYYGASAPSVVNIGSGSGFEFGIYYQNQYQPLINLMDDRNLSVSTDRDANQNGYYHIQIGDKFNSYYEVEEYTLSMNDLGVKAYPVYSDGWKLWFGSYTSEESVINAIDQYQGAINSTLNVVYPNNNLVQVLDSNNDIILIYDAMEREYFFRSFLEKGSSNIISINGKNFRGEVLFKSFNDSGLTVINYLTVQEYLYGVLPKEMSGEWPLEALKAQAVAARNFAIANFNKHGNYGFDVCSTTDCQVYGGYDVERPRSNSAVDETNGRILTYDGKIITAFFHSNSGGHTENSENIWSLSIPYIKGVDDEFSIGAPNSTWTKVYSPHEVSSILSQNGLNVGTVLDMVPLSFSENGRVLSLVIKGTRDEIILEKEKTRAIFGYNVVKSMWFDVNTDGNLHILSGQNNLPSKKAANSVYIMKDNGIERIPQRENYTVYNGTDYKKVSGYPDQFVLSGKGWGHGLGMSQWGAYNMAQLGYNYEEILKHYYVGTELE